MMCKKQTTRILVRLQRGNVGGRNAGGRNVAPRNPITRSEAKNRELSLLISLVIMRLSIRRVKLDLGVEEEPELSKQ